MHHPHHSHVLQLDIQGTPQAWISLEHAAVHVATGSVAWVDGSGPLATLRGGFNVARGRHSVINVFPIIALRHAKALAREDWDGKDAVRPLAARVQGSLYNQRGMSAVNA